LEKYRNVQQFKEAVKAMTSKFKKYFFPIPQIYLTAALFNPFYKEQGVKKMVEKIYSRLQIDDDEYPSLETCKSSIVPSARKFYDYYKLTSANTSSSHQPSSSRRRLNDFDQQVEDDLGLDSSTNNDFDEYLNQARESIRDENGEQQLLAWWKNRESQFPHLSKVARDMLAMQASLVASEQAFSAGRFIEGEYRYSLAKDSMEISVLFRDWINAERRTAGLPQLSAAAEAIIDEAIGDNSDDGMEALEEGNQVPIPENLSKEMIEKLQKLYFGNYNY